MAPEPDLTPILEDLAAGRIDASEAARRIDALKAAAEQTSEPSDDEIAGEADRPGQHASGVFNQPPFVEDVPPSPRRATGAKGVDRVSVRAVARRVRIVGDGSVATASVDGPHVLRRTGSVLEVTSDGDIGPSFDGFVLRPPRSFDDLRSIGLGKELLVRVNPSIAVDAEVERVAVTRLENGTFYAEITLRTSNRQQVLDARPSDAIGLALRTGTVIWVAENLLDRAGIPDEREPEADEEEQVAAFHEFLDQVDPEDFQG